MVEGRPEPEVVDYPVSPAGGELSPDAPVTDGGVPKHRKAGGMWPTGLQLLQIYIGVRAILLIADILSSHLSWNGVLSGPLQGWDAQHYIQIAKHGYPAVAPRSGGGQLTYSPAGFEPVFPLAIRLFIVLGVPAVGAALTVSLIGGAAATLLVWRLGVMAFGDRAGFDGTVLFAVFPGLAIAWGMFYCESVGLALAAGSLLLMARRHLMAAGGLAILATATSPLALPLAPAALWLALRAGALSRRQKGGSVVAARRAHGPSRISRLRPLGGNPLPRHPLLLAPAGPGVRCHD